MRDALARYEVVGVRTNVEFLARLMTAPAVRRRRISTRRSSSASAPICLRRGPRPRTSNGCWACLRCYWRRPAMRRRRGTARTDGRTPRAACATRLCATVRKTAACRGSFATVHTSCNGDRAGTLRGRLDATVTSSCRSSDDDLSARAYVRDGRRAPVPVGASIACSKWTGSLSTARGSRRCAWRAVGPDAGACARAAREGRRCRRAGRAAARARGDEDGAHDHRASAPGSWSESCVRSATRCGKTRSCWYFAMNATRLITPYVRCALQRREPYAAFSEGRP